MEQGMSSLQGFGDSKLFIDWINAKAELHNIFLLLVLEQVKPLKGNFKSIFLLGFERHKKDKNYNNTGLT